MNVLILWSVVMTPASGFASDHAGVLQLELERLQGTGRVLYVAAHPDDENTRLISYLAGAERHRVAYLSLTRGDGGQNRIGTEQGDHLGVIRTMELARARSIDGGEQFFTRARDFGFSKSAEESLQVWGHEDVLGDVVWVMRSFRPHVVITRFPEEGNTHGHHLASAILAREAFSAAADPKRFPEQLESLEPWSASRLLYNQPSFWRKPGDDSELKIDVGNYLPQLGMNVPELAAVSRTSHKSQGFGSLARYERVEEHFDHVAGSRPVDTLFSGIATDWDAQPGGKRLGRALRQALDDFDPAKPEAALPGLAQALRAVEDLEDAILRKDTERRLLDLFVRCAGVRITLRAETPVAVRGKELTVSVDMDVQRPVAELNIEEINFEFKGSLLAGNTWMREQAKYTFQIPSNAQVSRIDWIDSTAQPAQWSAFGEPPLIGAVSFVYRGARYRVERPIVYSGVDPVLGERRQLVRIEPTFTVTPLQPVITMQAGSPTPVRFRVRANVDAARGTLALELPAGLSVAPNDAPLTFSRTGEEQILGFELSGGQVENPEVIARVDGEPAWARASIDYPHLDPTVMLEPSRFRAIPLELDTSRISGPIAYVMGSGDRIPELLEAVGLKVELVEPADLVASKLERYHAVVLGVRAFNVRSELFRRIDDLLSFVEAGGTLIVQYNTNNYIDALPRSLGPYPFEITRARVTDQTAEITIQDDIVQSPHRLGPKDFEGWVQERGLYFASTWDERYRTPFEMADPGENAQRGSVLIAEHGDGRFVYTGISFFRQLPAGVPGAYRLFVNLLSH